MTRSVCTVCCVAVVVLAFVAAKTARGEEYAATVESDLRAAVEADWAAQETRAGRQPYGVDAAGEALARVGRLDAALAAMPGVADLRAEHAALERLRRRMDDVGQMDEPARRELYHQLRWLGRGMAMKNPLLAGRPVAFLKRRRFICQMLHEYIGYYYNYADLAGGGVFVLEQPGRSLKTRDLLAGQLPRGAYATLALAPGGDTLYFAHAEVRPVQRAHAPGIDWTMLPSADQVPAELNYYGPNRSAFHLFSIGADGRNLRQLTSGREDDFDPCPLPDGGLAFMSSRRGGFCRCDNPFEPIPTHTLHRLDPASGAVETLSWHETNEWHPSVLADGRIVYCRWDYVDRSAAQYHGLWVSNPDGSNPKILFGNYTTNISACFQPRAIPGTNRIVFVAGAHHANVGGSLVVLDPSRVDLDATSGEDRFESLTRLTPEVCFPETSEGWPKSYYEGPWPLSEDCYLVAFSFDPLPGMGSGVRRDSETGIYYFDRFGNMELLYREPGICCVGPIPLAPPPVSPAIAGTIDPSLGDEGEFLLADVGWSLLPLPEGRPIRQLRIFQVLPKETTHMANRPRIGMANAESARMLLGTVPVESDGSAYFRAPARKALYFQAVDADGRAVQSMRSVTYLQPGERRGCVGCHERPGAAPPARPLLATRRPPSTIRPGPEGTLPLSYPRLVQPVLDRSCVSCHDGSGGPHGGALALTGEPKGEFSRSYESLQPFVRWYEWGDRSIAQAVSRPGQCGADASPLSAVLDDANHAPLDVAPADRRRLYIWLDANAPFYGVYQAEAQIEQRAGGSVAPPHLQ